MRLLSPLLSNALSALSGRDICAGQKLVVRGGVEPPTFRFSGASASSLHVAGRGLMGHLAAQTMAGCRLAWPDTCRRWLPVWLPGTGGHGWIEASQAQNADIRPGPENRASRSATAAGSRQYQAAAR